MITERSIRSEPSLLTDEGVMPKLEREKQLDLPHVISFLGVVQVENRTDILLIKILLHGSIRSKKVICYIAAHARPHPLAHRIRETLFLPVNHLFRQPL